MAPAPAPSHDSSSSTKGASVTWRPTKIMNMRDLSKDDDFLSHLLVEKLGTGTVPLLVHKMDPSRRLPKTNVEDLLQIVRRLVATKGPAQNTVRQAVDELLALPPVRYYLKPYTQKQINAFATHASRYFELYHPGGSIEIAHTSRYSHRTGKSELCILATRPLAPGAVITELKGSMAHLTKEEDKELKRTDLRNTDIRRDFSVIHSRQMKKNHLFLGPARFVNHDCENNCELFREGKYITFRVMRPIGIGEEITAHYGDGYFGYRNRHCLCETCEKNGKGGYAPDHSDGEVESGCESVAVVSESDISDSEADPKGKGALNVNERRTRRGVYAIVQEEDDDSDESEDEEKETHKPLANVADNEDDMEIDAEGSGLSKLLAHSRESSHPFSTPSVSQRANFATPDPDIHCPAPSSSSPSTSSRINRFTPDSMKTPFRSIISTRRQKLSEEAVSHNLANRSARSSSAVGSTKTLKDQSERLPTPSIDKGKEKAKPVDDSEARVLRARPSSHITQPISMEVPKSEVPRGEDGKPLPTCVTCMNVLPVISVDSKVVWGLAFDTTPRRGRKRKEKQECPRCMRHFAIYAQPWPARVLGQNSASNSTPREESISVDISRRITHKALSTLDRKLASAAMAAKAYKRRALVEERSLKRRKVDPAPRVEMSAKAKELLTQGRGRGRPKLSANTPQEEDPPKRKRGRPRLSSPRRTQPPPDKPLKPKSLAVQSQPRDSNGRFGKKASTNGKFVRKKYSSLRSGVSRAQRAVERTKVKLWLQSRNEGSRAKFDEESPGDHGHELSPIRKRTDEGTFDIQQPPTKRPRGLSHVEKDIDDLLPPLPSKYDGTPSYRFKGMGSSLLCRPNPLNFARRKWIPRFLDDISLTTDESETGSPPRASESENEVPVTPEEHDALPIIVETSASPRLDRLHIRSSDDTATAKHLVGALTFKPSPINFARRRWSSTPRSPIDAGPTTRRKDRIEGSSSFYSPDIIDIGEGGAPRHQDETVIHASTVSSSAPIPGWLSANRHSGISLEEQDCTDSSKFVLQRQASFGALKVTVKNTDHTSSCFVPASDDTPSSEEDERIESMASRFRVVYDSELPAVVPWKNTPATPMSQYLQKSATFCTDDPSSPPNFVHAGWDNAGWDTSSDVSTD